MLRRSASVLTAMVLLVGACRSGIETSRSELELEPTTTTASAPGVPADPLEAALATEHVSVVATAAVDQVTVHEEPAESSRLAMTLPRFDPDYVGEDGTRTTQTFLVQESRDGWLRVLLPVRPNGTTGWIPSGQVTLSQHRYGIVVELGAKRLVATEDGEPFLETTIAVGTRDTPTPGGRFYLNALLRPPDPDTIYGTYAYALSGYSDTLRSFAGGDGVIGIHGTNDPSVMGSDVSHGCIRMRNEDIEALVAELPLGTPVEIRA